MVIAALAGGARAAAVDVATLYAASIVTGFGVAIIQPAMPTLVREWLPRHIAFGTIAYSSGMLMGAMFATVFTIPVVLPLVGGSWRRDLVAWAVPALLIAPVFFLLSPKTRFAWRRQCRDRRALVAGLEKSGRVAARPDLRQQQQRIFFDQCFSRRLPHQPRQAGTARPRTGLAQRRADRHADHLADDGESHAAAGVAVPDLRPDPAGVVSRTDVHPVDAVDHHLFGYRLASPPRSP